MNPEQRIRVWSNIARRWQRRWFGLGFAAGVLAGTGIVLTTSRATAPAMPTVSARFGWPRRNINEQQSASEATATGGSE